MIKYSMIRFRPNQQVQLFPFPGLLPLRSLNSKRRSLISWRWNCIEMVTQFTELSHPLKSKKVRSLPLTSKHLRIFSSSKLENCSSTTMVQMMRGTSKIWERIFPWTLRNSKQVNLWPSIFDHLIETIFTNIQF